MNSLLGLPPDASGQGAQIDSIIGMVHWLMILLFVGWSAFFAYCLVRFRRKRNAIAKYSGSKGRVSTWLEAGVAGAEAVLLIGFAIPVWSSRVNALPPEEEATVVRVVAEQFVWNIHYPGPDGVFGRSDAKLISADNPLGLDRNDPDAKDDITTINQLNLPVGKPVIVYLTTKDVIHSFALPLFRVKQDAIPGQRIPVWFTPRETTAELRNSAAREYSIKKVPVPPDLVRMVFMKEYKRPDSTTVASVGDYLTDDIALELGKLGQSTALLAPDQPTEIACSQLCGLGHYRMVGYINVQTADEYAAWLAEQSSALTQ